MITLGITLSLKKWPISKSADNNASVSSSCKKKKKGCQGLYQENKTEFSNCEDKKDVNSLFRNKKSPMGVEPMTFPIPVEFSNYKATLHIKKISLKLKKNLCTGCRMNTASTMQNVLASWTWVTLLRGWCIRCRLPLGTQCFARFHTCTNRI